MVMKTLMKCDYDVIMKTSKHLIIAGGTSLIDGIGEKVTSTIHEFFPTLQTEYIKEESSVLQKYSAWRGGALIANSDSMKDVWVTKQEYEENGVGIVDRRCG